MSTQSLYDILGVKKSASAQEIKKAFRLLARDKHPDKIRNDRGADDVFKKISNAYSTLSNPQNRARYDRGDIDENGSSVQKSNNQAKTRPATNMGNIRIAGSDVFYILRIDFIDAVNGGIKNIGMTTGRKIRVTIPPGTRHKQTLRLKGQGAPGSGGGADGAALVEILIGDHDLFRIDGFDIVHDQPISLKLAVLGGRLMVPGCNGEAVNILIPKNASSGTTVRLPGKGMRKNDGGFGDQVVTLMVQLPEYGNRELTRFMHQWNPSEEVPSINPAKTPLNKTAGI